MNNSLFDKHRTQVYICINAICNLKCSYCFINKNEKLKKIDDMIKETAKTDYYVNIIKEIFTDHNLLTSLDMWGGEPLLSLERVYDTYYELLKIYPNLNEFSFSTNLTVDNFLDKLQGLFEIQNKFKDRNFVVDMQISVDGPEYITDKYRGKGTTKKIIQNFDLLLNNIKNILPDNVTLSMHTKPTLTNEDFVNMQDYDFMLEYFKFFEREFYEKVDSLNISNVQMYPTVYNMATPIHNTQEDGIRFAKVCKTAVQMNKDIVENNVLKYFSNVVPFRKYHPNELNASVEKETFSMSGGVCGLGRNVIGILPNNMLTMCHRSFTSCIDDYYDAIVLPEDLKISSKSFSLKKSQTVFDKSFLPEFTNKINCYYNKSSKHALSGLAILIQMLAISGQIDKKFTDFKEALIGARFITLYHSLCLYDNETETGTFTLPHTGLIKLLLNGAMEYIMDKGD